jgi:hypothetical protein
MPRAAVSNSVKLFFHIFFALRFVPQVVWFVIVREWFLTLKKILKRRAINAAWHKKTKTPHPACGHLLPSAEKESGQTLFLGNYCGRMRGWWHHWWLDAVGDFPAPIIFKKPC